MVSRRSLQPSKIHNISPNLGCKIENSSNTTKHNPKLHALHGSKIIIHAKRQETSTTIRQCSVLSGFSDYRTRIFGRQNSDIGCINGQRRQKTLRLSVVPPCRLFMPLLPPNILQATKSKTTSFMGCNENIFQCTKPMHSSLKEPSK